MSKKTTTILAVALLLSALAVLSASVAFAAGATQQTANVEKTSDGTPVGTATLVRNSAGLSFNLHTTMLPAEHVITVWVKVFSPSEPGGVFLKPVPGARGITLSDGSIRLAGSANANKNSEDDPPGSIPFPDDFDPMNDRVELHIQDHGAADSVDIGDELTQPIAGFLVQKAVFP